MILLCNNFQRRPTLLLVDGCNLAQLTAWAYRAMCFQLCSPTSCKLFFETWKPTQ